MPNWATKLLLAMLTLCACSGCERAPPEIQNPQGLEPFPIVDQGPEPVASQVAEVAQAAVCEKGAVPVLSDFDAVYRALEKIPSYKDEFETSEAFATRRAASLSLLPKVVAIEFPVGELRYDADAQQFWVGTRDIGDGQAVPYYFNSDVSNVNQNLDIAWMTTEYVGDYEATNAFGVRKLVRTSNIDYRVLFERKIDERLQENPTLFLAAASRRDDFDRLMKIPMGTEEARKAQGNFRGAAVVRIQPPYNDSSNGRQAPTVDSPTDTFISARVVFADILCVVILDENGVVLVASDTR
jgi:hypothetical protein